MNLTIFDVEHGACALLTCDNGQRLMLDCGHNASTGWKPGDYLASIGVGTLDMLAITNYDEDHVSGIDNLLKRVDVKLLLGNPTVSADVLTRLKSETGSGPGISLLANVLRGLGTPTWQWLGPPVSWNCNAYPTFTDENNLSLALHLNLNGFGFLFPGDLESAGWKALLAARAEFRTAVKNTRVLMASHHGRLSGVCTELFNDYGCKPDLVVISDDYHQYDTQATTTYYKSKAAGIHNFRTAGTTRWVLTTRSDGTINFNFPAGGGCIVT
jgi:beta-lactamase superfamily II metal-dependent hydrolase